MQFVTDDLRPIPGAIRIPQEPVLNEMIIDASVVQDADKQLETVECEDADEEEREHEHVPEHAH
jgi:hypothetical protein